MRPFGYARPQTLPELFALLAHHGASARLLAGGTDLVVRIRNGHYTPDVVIDVKRVPELRADIVEVDGVLRFGARVVMTTVVNDSRVQQYFPALMEAASVVGSIQIRNRATLVGNVCNASPAADTAPALLVYGAIVNVVSAAGDRRIPIEEFFIGPGKTALRLGEILHSIDLQIPEQRTGSAFGRITRRFGVDLATINLCCLVRDSGKAAFAYGAAAPRPFIVHDESGSLGELHAAPGVQEAALHNLLSHAAPISDIRADRDYRLAMLLVESRRALDKAIHRRDSSRGRT